MKDLKVKNLNNNGRVVPYQFEIFYKENNKNYKIFQSYESIIIKWENGIIIEVGINWNFSRTTEKYCKILTNTNKKEFEKMLKEEFKLNKETLIYVRNN